MDDAQEGTDSDDDGQEDEVAELDVDLMEDEDERESDSEPESVVAGQGGDSSDEEELSDAKNERQEGGRKENGTALALKAGAALGKVGASQKKKEQEVEEKEERTIFVGNLPTTFNTKRVKTVFKAYGAVESVRLRSVAVEGMAVDKDGDQVRYIARLLGLLRARVLFCPCRHATERKFSKLS